MRLLLVFALALVSVVAAQKRYDGYQVFEVKAKDKAAFSAMVQLFESSNYDFWKEPRGLDHSMDVMVAPAFNKVFIDVLKVFGMEYRIKISDVQVQIDEGKKDIAPPLKQPRGVRHGRNGTPRYSLNWTSYSDYPAIIEFVNEIAAAHPDKVSVRSVGRTVEGRDMPLVTISTGGTGKNAIFVDGGIHAREWISPSFVTWLIRELVENYDAHPQYVDNVDWHIIPVVNPDGYSYSHATNGDRLWRKNRTPNAGSSCIGTDLNRNFGFHWDEGGSSDLPCSDTYNGGAAFSQLESQHVRDAINSVAATTKAYLTYHSYGQYFLYPWGWTSDLPEDWQLLDDLAQRAVAKLTAVYGTRYTIGTSTNTLYIASGGSDDWAKGVAGVSFSYTPEMRDTGTFGFQLPAGQIMPNNLEMWEAVKVIAEEFF